jgi:hypothetical protein
MRQRLPPQQQQRGPRCGGGRQRHRRADAGCPAPAAGRRRGSAGGAWASGSAWPAAAAAVLRPPGAGHPIIFAKPAGGGSQLQLGARHRRLSGQHHALHTLRARVQQQRRERRHRRAAAARPVWVPHRTHRGGVRPPDSQHPGGGCRRGSSTCGLQCIAQPAGTARGRPAGQHGSPVTTPSRCSSRGPPQPRGFPTHPLQVKVNALVHSMTAADLSVQGGQVTAIAPPYVAGAFQIFEVGAGASQAFLGCQRSDVLDRVAILQGRASSGAAHRVAKACFTFGGRRTRPSPMAWPGLTARLWALPCSFAGHVTAV